MRRRIDRFLEDALEAFAGWYIASDWLGKERDCVNLFAMRFLAERVRQGAAVEHLPQIRVEGAVPQPAGSSKRSAPKDLVIWRDPHGTAWDADWNPVRVPWVVMEWKTRRGRRAEADFDPHDTDWLTRFTDEFPGTLGFLVTVSHADGFRSVAWAKVSGGRVGSCRLVE